MKSNKSIIILVTCIIITGLNISDFMNKTLIYSATVDAADAKTKKPEDINNENQKKIITAGVPIQRKRIDDFIAQTASYKNYEAAAKGLSDPIKGYDVLYILRRGPAAINYVDGQFTVTLADRRVAKVYSFLKEMSPEQASEKTEKLFDQKLSELKDCWADIIAFTDVPLKDGKVSSKAPHYEEPKRFYRAVAAALFLCAEFNDIKTVLNKIDQWDEFGTRLVKKTSQLADPLFLRSFHHKSKYDGAIQPLYLLNVYAFLLERKHIVKVTDLKLKISGDLPDFMEIPFASWNAHTNPRDFTQNHRGVPVEETWKLFPIKYANAWYPLPESQLKTLNEVRALVDEYK